MKTLKVLTLLLCLSVASFAHASKKVEATSYRKGYAVVTIETQTQGKNGETEIKSQNLCEMEISVPVYEAHADNLEIKMAQTVQKCAVKIGQIEANVWISPLILNSNVKGLDTVKNGAYAKAPKWLSESFRKAEGRATAYMNTIYLFPKDYDIYKESENLQPDVMSQITQLYEMLGDTAPTQIAVVVDKTQPTILLSTSTDPSLKYCAEHSADNYCSLRYRIKSEVTFKSE